MYDSPILPDKPEILARVVGEHIFLERQRQYTRRLKWQLAQAYLNGMRRFEFIGPDRTLVGFGSDREGKTPVQVPALLSDVNKVAGLLQQMDLSPVVGRNGATLDGVRDRGFMQTVLDATITDSQRRKVVADAAHLVANLGTVGIAANVCDHPVVGLIGDLEVVHPDELLPFPSLGFDMTKLRGFIRVRRVPVEAIKKWFPSKARSIQSNVREMAVGRRRATSPPQGLYSMTPVNAGGSAVSSAQSAAAIGDDGYLEAEFWELWVEGPAQTCSRYIAGSGKYIIADLNFDELGTLYYPSVSVIKFWEGGDFYGVGLYDAIYSLDREFEASVKSLVNNVKDLDRFHILLIPPGTVDERLAFKETGVNLKVLQYKPEASILGMNDMKPMTISPTNAGEAPGRTAAYLQGLVRSIVPVRDILSEKGRVDSYQGLQFLEEEGQRSGVVPVSNFANGFAALWRSFGLRTLSQMSRSGASVRVKKIDLGMVGTRVNFDNMTVSLGANRMPDVLSLDFGVKQQTPRSQSIRKQEATSFLEKQLVTMQEYKRLAMKEGWDPAIDMEADVQAYRTVCANIVSVFNDGETPGPIIWTTPSTERPDIQLPTLDEFMASPECHRASSEVVNQLVRYRDTLLSYQQRMLPEGVPDPFEAALTNPDNPSTLSMNQPPSLPGDPS